MSEIDELRRRVERLERAIFPMEHPPQPYMPTPIGIPKIACMKCGLKLEGVMGYVCPRADCPTTPRVTA